MPFSNVPVKNPGRYFEKFVKIVQPIGGESGQAGAAQFCNKGWERKKILESVNFNFLFLRTPAFQGWSPQMNSQNGSKKDCTNTGFGMKNWNNNLTVVGRCRIINEIISRYVNLIFSIFVINAFYFVYHLFESFHFPVFIIHFLLKVSDHLSLLK